MARERRQFKGASRRVAAHHATGCLRHDWWGDKTSTVSVAYHPIHTLAQPEGERYGGRPALEEQHHFVARRELWCTDHEPPVASDLTARHPEVHRRTRLPLDPIEYRQRHDRFDRPPIADDLRANINHSPVHNEFRRRHHLREFGWHDDHRRERCCAEHSDYSDNDRRTAPFALSHSSPLLRSSHAPPRAPPAPLAHSLLVAPIIGARWSAPAACDRTDRDR